MLRIWLPLIKDYKNYGLSDLKFSPSNASYTTQQSNGKIGTNCYYNSSNTDGGLISDKTIYLGNNLSMCCWVKFSSLMEGANLGASMGGQHRYPTSTGMGLTIKYVTASTGYLSLNTGGGGSDGNRTYNTYCGQTLLNANVWYHVCFTYDGNTIKLYVNGRLDGTHTYSDQVNVPDYVHVFTWSSNDNAGNPTIHPNYKLHGYMNDFRIYDHTLSAREVKEISKGLVAHYELKGMGRTNYLKGAGLYTENNPLIRNSTDVSHMNDSYVYHTGTLSVTVPTDGTYTLVLECDGVPSGHVTSGTPASSRCFCFFLQNTSTSTHYSWKNYGTGVSGEKYGQFDLPAGTYHVRTNLYAADNVKYTLKFWNMKMVKGGYDPYDIWCPNANDTLYSTLGLNTDIESDVSGYGNHATKSTTFEVANGSPKYGTCYVFPNSSYINCGRGTMVRDAITVNCWAYMDNWGDYTNRRIASCTESGGWNLEPNAENAANGMCFAVGTGASSNTYINATANIACSSMSSGWHMFTGTYDGYTARIYIDGVYRGSSSSFGSRTPIFYNSTNSVFIGAEAGASGSTPGGSYFNGKISDFRIYGTALSSDDIAELYKVPASTDKDGNLFACDFYENNKNSVDRNGVFSTGGFGDRLAPTFDMKLKTLEDGSVWGRIHNLDLSADKIFYKNASEVSRYTARANRYSRMGDVEKFNNNGTYEFMLTYPSIPDREISGEYTILDYIESTGTQYIKTGVKGGAIWQFDIQFTDIGTRQLMGYGGDGGEYWGIQVNGKYGLFEHSVIGYGGDRDVIVHDFSKGNSNTLWVENQLLGVGNDNVTSKEYELFSIINGMYACKAKMYRCKCIQNGSLIRDFVPVQRNLDGIIGLLDIVNNVFYTNRGSGTFQAGYKADYIWLDYIESTGSQYIDTGISPTSTMEAEVAFTPTGGLTENAIFGSTWSASGYFLMFYQNKIRWHSGGKSVDIGSYSAGNRVVCHCTNSYITVNGSRYAISGGANSSNNIFIFSTADLKTLNGIGRLEYMKIWDNGDLIRDFVPCINTSGAVGLFDRITNSFFANNGSGKFIAGCKTYVPLNYIESSGTQYIDTGITYSDSNSYEVQMQVVYNTNSPANQIIGFNGHSGMGIGSSGATWWECGNALNANTMYTLRWVKSGYNWIREINGASYSGTNGNVGSGWSGTMKLFAATTSSGDSSINYYCHSKLYYAKIYVNGSLTRDYVPAMNASGTVGLYDKVTKTFYANNGSGTFTAGKVNFNQPIPKYNRWAQTSSPNASSVSGFTPIATTWNAHNYGIRKHGADCLYNCDSGGTWYAPIGQYNIWEGGIPAADGTPQSKTELWVRIDNFKEKDKLSIFNGSVTATDYIEF